MKKKKKREWKFFGRERETEREDGKDIEEKVPRTC